MAQCKSNLRQIGLALQSYVADNSAHALHLWGSEWQDGGRVSWHSALQGYFPPRTYPTGPVFRCPDNPTHEASIFLPLSFGSYGYNDRGSVSETYSDSDTFVGLGGAREGWDNPIDPVRHNVRAARESMVVAPSDMIALGDGMYAGGSIEPDGRKLSFTTDMLSLGLHRSIIGEIPAEERTLETAAEAKRHHARYNVGFCDGHLETLESRILFSEESRRIARWNIDHKPH